MVRKNGTCRSVELRIPIGRIVAGHNRAHAHSARMIHLVHDDDVLERSSRSDAEDFLELFVGGDKDGAGAGILQYEGRLLGRERRINRDIHDAHEQAGPVHDRPLKAICSNQSYAIAFGNAPMLQLPSSAYHARIKLARAYVVPYACRLIAHYARQVAIDGDKEDVVQSAERSQA